MDFHNLINVANKNIASSSSDKYYKARFEPPKKESKDKKLSNNIKRFLEKREQEEREQQLKKNEEARALMAKRDVKQKNKINKMLKVIKSANKSVLDDAKDEKDTAITLEGGITEDDYGYVSQEASQFYKKLMQQYGNNPDTPAFQMNKNGKSVDKRSMQEKLERAKRDMDDRIIKEKEHRHRSSKAPSKEASKSIETTTGTSKPDKSTQKTVKKPFRPAPSLSFNDILALAAKKQHEDIVIPTKSKQEPERLMTKKEREEEEQKLLAAKRKAERNKSPEKKKLNPQKSEKSQSSKLYAALTDKNVKQPTKLVSKPESKQPATKQPAKMNGPRTSGQVQNIPNTNTNIKATNAKDVAKRKPVDAPHLSKEKKANPPSSCRSVHMQESRNVKAIKRRIVDSDEESEYDSELDDFIDDGDDGEFDVSTQIRSIFGYDKRRCVDEDFDDREMESSFAQQMKEEQLSKKIGLLEDLEDMKQEELEKKRKAMHKKRKVK